MGYEVAEIFSKYIEKFKYEDLDKNTLFNSKKFLLDTIGVAIAGSTGAKLDNLKNVVKNWSYGSECSVFGSKELFSRDAATLLNAYQIHCLEYDCIHEGAIVHPMAAILSSMLSYCQIKSKDQNPINGKEFLMSMILGVDIAAYLGVCSKGELRFFRPATASGFGSVAALSKIEKFTSLQINNALGIMYSQTSGNMQSHVEGVPILGLQVGFNAKSALASVDLTIAGFPGPRRVFNGEHGYFKLIENNQFDIFEIKENLGKKWMINELAHKPYPSGRLTHGLVHAIRELKTKYKIDMDDISSIDCLVPPGVFKLVSRPIVDNLTTNYAKLCASFVGASYINHNHLNIETFTEDNYLKNERTHHIAKKIIIKKNDKLNEKVLTPQLFVIELKNHKKIKIILNDVFGHPNVPLSEKEYIEKFKYCCSYSTTPIEKNKIQEIIDFIFDLEKKNDIVNLFEIIQQKTKA